MMNVQIAYTTFQNLSGILGNVSNVPTLKAKHRKEYKELIALLVQNIELATREATELKKYIESTGFNKDELFLMFDLLDPINEKIQHLDTSKKPKSLQKAYGMLVEGVMELVNTISDLLWDNLLSNEEVLDKLIDEAKNDTILDMKTLCNPN